MSLRGHDHQVAIELGDCETEYVLKLRAELARLEAMPLPGGRGFQQQREARIQSIRERLRS